MGFQWIMTDDGGGWVDGTAYVVHIGARLICINSLLLPHSTGSSSCTARPLLSCVRLYSLHSRQKARS